MDHTRSWCVAVLVGGGSETALLAVLEDMSLGVPAIATDHGGSLEVRGAAGLLVPPGIPRRSQTPSHGRSTTGSSTPHVSRLDQGCALRVTRSSTTGAHCWKPWTTGAGDPIGDQGSGGSHIAVLVSGPSPSSKTPHSRVDVIVNNQR